MSFRVDMRLLLRTGVTFLCLSGMMTGQNALAGDVFRVSGISVDASAGSAILAREAAVAKGQAEAFARLLRRLTRRDDWVRLPEIDGNQVQAYVRGFQIANEKSSSTRYLARLTVTFEGGQVRNLLQQWDIPFSRSQAKPAVLILLYEGPDGLELWGETNPWWRAWAELDLENILTPVKMPLGDLQDITGLSVEQVERDDREAFAKYAARYGTDRILVAWAQTDIQGRFLGASLRFLRSDVPGVSRTWTIQASDISNISDDARAEQEAGPADMMEPERKAARRLLELMGNEWKAETIVSAGDRNALSVSVVYSSLSEWVFLKRRLQQTAIVEEVTVVALSTDGAIVEVDYSGTPETLRLNLAQKNLALESIDGYWTLMAQSTSGG